MALERELREIVTAVWSAVDDGVTVVPIESRDPSSGPAMTGMVSIRGGWNGAVAVEFAVPAAERIARRVEGATSPDAVRTAIEAVTEAIATRCQVLFPNSVAAPATVVNGLQSFPGLVLVLQRAFRVGPDWVSVVILQQGRRHGR